MKPTHTLSGKCVLVVEDDDWFAGHLVRALESVGARARALGSLEAVKALISSGYAVDAAVIDMMVKRSKTGKSLPLVGLEVANVLRAGSPKLPLLAISTALGEKELTLVASYFSSFVNKADIGFGHEGQFLERLTSVILGKHLRKPRVFIVHGHDHAAVRSLCKFLRSAFHFEDFVVLQKLPGGGKTVIEKFEDYATGCDIAFVLLTPDDVGYAKNNPKVREERTRQNVVFELGFFYAKLRRQQGSVILLKKGRTAIPSDLHGIEFIDISAGIPAAHELIQKQIELIKWL
jgi:predicted nucleotide-binding protein